MVMVAVDVSSLQVYPQPRLVGLVLQTAFKVLNLSGCGPD